MARLAVSVFTVTCFLNIEAFKDVPQNKYAWAKPCVPGTFSPGPGCSQCFCNSRRKLICGPPGDCKLSLFEVPKEAVIERLLSREKLSSLPVADKGAECKPGLSYRVDCNRCLCLEKKSLMCETQLCRRSSNDTNTFNANQLTEKSCHDDVIQAKDCITPSKTEDKRPLKLAKQKMRCIPGKRYRIKSVCKECICTKDNVLQCMRLRTKCRGGSSSEFEVTEADLDIKLFDSAETCTPGVVYQRDCNTCICNENTSLDCTQEICAQD